MLLILLALLYTALAALSIYLLFWLWLCLTLGFYIYFGLKYDAIDGTNNVDGWIKEVKALFNKKYAKKSND